MGRKIVILYGAGRNVRLYIQALAEKYEIAYIMDQAKEKQGKKIQGIDVVAPKAEYVRRFPIIVTIDDYKSAADTIHAIDGNAKLFGTMGNPNGFMLYFFDESFTFRETIKNYTTYIPLGNIEVYNSFNKYVPGKRRYFVLGSTDNLSVLSATGGSAIVLKQLWDVNNKYKMIDNLIILCPGMAVVPEGIPVNQVEKYDEQLAAEYYEVIHTFEEKDDNNSIELLQLYCRIRILKDFLYRMNLMFQFGKEDVFLLEDINICAAFLLQFPDLPYIIEAYHTPGIYSSHIKNTMPDLVDVYDKLQLEQIQRIKRWVFPTQGAAQGFYETANENMQSAFKECDISVLYTYFNPKREIVPDDAFCLELSKLPLHDLLFASASFLYHSKGIERIPRMLHKIKKQTGLKIFWVLIGKGEMENAVRENIDTYLSADEYLWYNCRFDNQDNVFELFRRADFYIMMHRVSVSDLSTLQAMAYGCVPFLSKTGGNIEFCAFHNGILVDPLDEKIEWSEYFHDSKLDRVFLESQKRLNRRIISEHFSSYAFLKGYRDYLYGVG